MRVVAELVGIVAGVLAIGAFFVRWWTQRQKMRQRALGLDRELPPGDRGE